MATFYSGSSRGYTLRLDVTQGTGNTTTNTTPVSWALYLVITSNYFQGLVDEGYLNINGVRVWNKPASLNLTSGYYTHTLGSGSLNVGHNDDGTKSIALYATFSASSGGWGPVGLVINTSMALTTIPRARTVFVGNSSGVATRGVVYVGNSSGVAVVAKEIYVGNANGVAVKAKY